MHLTRRWLSLVAVASLLTGTPVGAASDKELVAVRGISGYRAAPAADFRRVISRQVLADDNVAVTQAASNAFVVLPDSSEVALGAATSVQVGAFNNPLSVTPTTVTLRGGALRFNVKHPAGAAANYVFKTATSQIAVRGTIALYGTSANGDVISCLVCAPGDAVATVGERTFSLASGQTLFIAPDHTVNSTNGESAPAQAFAGTGLATSATSTIAFTAEVQAAAAAANEAAAAAAASSNAAVIGAGLAGATVAGGLLSGTSKPAQTPAPSEPGSAQISGARPAPAPTPAPTRPPH
jgi:hypothetical protein